MRVVVQGRGACGGVRHCLPACLPTCLRPVFDLSPTCLPSPETCLPQEAGQVEDGCARRLSPDLSPAVGGSSCTHTLYRSHSHPHTHSLSHTLTPSHTLLLPQGAGPVVGGCARRWSMRWGTIPSCSTSWLLFRASTATRARVPRVHSSPIQKVHARFNRLIWA